MIYQQCLITYFSILLGRNCEVNHLKLLENVNQVFHFRVLKMLLPLGIKPLTRHQKLSLHVRWTRIMSKPVWQSKLYEFNYPNFKPVIKLIWLSAGAHVTRTYSLLTELGSDLLQNMIEWWVSQFFHRSEIWESCCFWFHTCAWYNGGKVESFSVPAPPRKLPN